MSDFDPGPPPAAVAHDDHALAAWTAHVAGQLLLRVRGEGLTGRELKDAGDLAAHELLMGLLREHRPDDAVLSEEEHRGTGSVHDRHTADRVWIVDPLDGTREFSEPPRDDWAVHVALWQRHPEGARVGAADGELVAGAVALPAIGETFHTAEPSVLPPWSGSHPRVAVSRTRPPAFVEAMTAALGGELVPMGSAGAKVMAVVRGTVEAYVHTGGQYEWDSAAPVAVARAAGLFTSRVDGAELVYNQDDVLLPDLVVCRPELSEDVLAFVRDHGTD